MQFSTSESGDENKFLQTNDYRYKNPLSFRFQETKVIWHYSQIKWIKIGSSFFLQIFKKKYRSRHKPKVNDPRQVSLLWVFVVKYTILKDSCDIIWNNFLFYGNCNLVYNFGLCLQLSNIQKNVGLMKI